MNLIEGIILVISIDIVEIKFIKNKKIILKL